MRMLLHLPVNHRFRTLHRFLAGLTGLYVLLYGIVGLAVSRGHGAFARGHIVALGLRTNFGFAVLSIIVGAAVLVGIIVNHNWDHILNLFGGLAFLVVGMLMLGLLRTDANFLGFSMVNVIVSFVFGTVVFAAGLYGRTGTESGAHRRV